MNKITRVMKQADDEMFKADDLTRKAGEMADLALTAEKVIRSLPALLMLCLIPFLPLFTDYFIEHSAAGELMRNQSAPMASGTSDAAGTLTAALTAGEVSLPPIQAETQPSMKAMMFIILGQVAVVFALGYFAKSADIEGLSYTVLLGMGLLAALAVPCISLSTIFAMAHPSTGEASSTPGWMQMFGQNGYFIGFCILSLAAHCLLWAMAAEIPQAFHELPKALERERYLRAQRRCESAAQRCEVRAEQYVVKIMADDKRLAERTKRKDQEVDLEFIYITAHPRVAALIEKYRKAA